MNLAPNDKPQLNSDPTPNPTLSLSVTPYLYGGPAPEPHANMLSGWRALRQAAMAPARDPDSTKSRLHVATLPANAGASAPDAVSFNDVFSWAKTAGSAPRPAHSPDADPDPGLDPAPDPESESAAKPPTIERIQP